MDSTFEYRVSSIPKGNGRTRLVYIPGAEYKIRLRSHLPRLLSTLKELDSEGVCHAFVKERNCATNAMQHIGYRYSISLDIKDFFDSVRINHVKGLISPHIIQDCFIDGAPRQGLPTSPLIANIALVEADKNILKALRLLKTPVSYTRYADDMTISFDDKKAMAKIIAIVKKVLAAEGFALNQGKTRIQASANGRVIITGIGVDSTGIYPTRVTKRKLRAAIHQKKWGSAIGLAEWSLCKLPGSGAKRALESYRRTIRNRITRCRFCGENGLLWQTQHGERLILVDAKSRAKHACPATPDPVNRQEFSQSLINLGFRYIKLASNTWFSGYAYFAASESMVVMLRKRGVDTCCLSSTHLVVRSDGSAILSGGKIERLSYETSEQYVHAVILKEAKRFAMAVSSDSSWIEEGFDDYSNYL